MKKLPVGIQTFTKIIQGDYYYVDKTPLIEQLLHAGQYIFLSRPRRFGKSLLLDTLAELFAGNQALFKGLYLADKWDWQTSYPVIRISFAEGLLKDGGELNRRSQKILRYNADKLGVDISVSDDISGSFIDLIRAVKQKTGKKVVILIDEYDKPMLDNLTDAATVTEIRDGLRDLYSVIKGQDANIRFAMLTGVSKFSKVNVFSGLNNLNDVSLDAAFSALCGYTQTDLEQVFAPELPGLDLADIKRWYNGYNWTGEAVYNPFDILLLLQKRVFKPYWFETGTPTFIIEHLSHQATFLPKLDQINANSSLLSAFEIDHISTEALLFQSGYLTIHSVSYLGVQPRYHLGFPNKEVQASLMHAMLYRIAPPSSSSPSSPSEKSADLYELLLTNNFSAMSALFTAFYASIPYDWYRNNPIAQYEGYYASVFYAYFASLGLDIRLEDITSLGRIDMTVDFNDCYYLFEFKVVEGKTDEHNTALKQLKDKNYAQKYLADKQAIYLIGVEFDKNQREVVGFTAEAVPLS